MLIFDGFSTKGVSDFTFSSEKELFSWTYLLRRQHEWQKYLQFEIRFLKSETHFLTSDKQKYNAGKISSNYFYHKKLELLEIT